MKLIKCRRPSRPRSPARNQACEPDRVDPARKAPLGFGSSPNGPADRGKAQEGPATLRTPPPRRTRADGPAIPIGRQFGTRRSDTDRTVLSTEEREPTAGEEEREPEGNVSDEASADAISPGRRRNRNYTKPRAMKPSAVLTGSSSSGLISNCANATAHNIAASTAKSPCARLTIRITPKMMLKPSAESARTPPSKSAVDDGLPGDHGGHGAHLQTKGRMSACPLSRGCSAVRAACGPRGSGLGGACAAGAVRRRQRVSHCRRSRRLPVRRGTPVPARPGRPVSSPDPRL